MKAWLQYVRNTIIIQAKKLNSLNLAYVSLPLKFNKRKINVKKNVRIYDLNSWEYFMWYKFIDNIKIQKITDSFEVIFKSKKANRIRDNMLSNIEKYLEIYTSYPKIMWKYFNPTS